MSNTKSKKLESENYKGFTIRPKEEQGVVKYVVDSGRKFSKRQQKRCKTKEEAKDLCSEWKRILDTEGKGAWELSEEQRQEAAKAFELMEELGIVDLSLSEIVEQYHEQMPKVGDLLMEEMREQFLEYYEKRLEKGKSLRTLQSYRDQTRLLADEFTDRTVRSIKGDELWDYLLRLQDERNWSTGTVSKHNTGWKTFFQFCIDEEQIDRCPLKEKKIASRIKKHTEQGPLPAPAIPTIENTSSLLKEGWKARDKGMLQAIAVLVFGGLRPNAEMMKLQWSDYDRKGNEGFINVGGDRSKNEGSARCVKICDAAIEWLDYAKAYMESKRLIHSFEMLELLERKKSSRGLGEEDRKRIRALKRQERLLVTEVINEHGENAEALRFKPNDWKRNWLRLRNDSGIIEWEEDTTRHGWASYSYGLDGDPEKLRRELGHCDQRMLKHYLKVNKTIRDKAEQYFNLSPETVLSPAEYDIFQSESESFRNLLTNHQNHE